MNWFQAAQPALLYIVPAVMGFLALHCIWNREVKPLLEFDESNTELNLKKAALTNIARRLNEVIERQAKPL
ncbi:hypothetical protein ERO13_D13G223201v2 [Gossypium hirsutum]|nr:hypothetical protein ERO13_D13G223201v2 [Gossypium hirsutum]